MYGVRIAYRERSKVSPSILPACLLMLSSLPILKSPSWSVLVNTTRPSLVAESYLTSFDGIGNPPFCGIAVNVFVPEPTYSNVCDDDVICERWWNVIL